MSFLAEMARSSRERSRAGASATDEASLRRRARETEPAPELRLDSRLSLIAEIKLRSPASGRLTAGRDVRERARQYERGGAAAISVLTEPTRFDGSLEHLEVASRAVGVPTMRKDFLVEPFQLFEARVAGAGGVLLIARMLEGGALDEMLDAAAEADLWVLLEAFDSADLDRAAAVLEARADRRPRTLVGLNARDLETLQVDPGRLERLASRLPAHSVAVAESGVGSPGRVRRLVGCGYRVALVGSALMSAIDPTATVRQLIAAGRGIRVKICGITRESDLRDAVEAGADAVGFVLSPSPRQIGPSRAAELAGQAPAHVSRIAVLRHPPAELVRATLDAFAPDGADWIQVEAEDRDRIPVGVGFLPVFHDDEDLIDRVRGWDGTVHLEGPGRGGRGVGVDLDRARLAARGRRLILAGGLDPDNVADAIARVRPFGVDVSSGVERAAGIKDAGRMRAFVAAARSQNEEPVR